MIKREGLKHAQISSVLVPWCNMCNKGQGQTHFHPTMQMYHLAHLYSNVTIKIFNLLLFLALFSKVTNKI